MRELLGIDDGIQVGHHFGAGPILGADDFAVDASLAIDDVGFWVHGGAVVERNLLGGIAVGGKVEGVGGEEILVGGLVVIHADADDGGAEWRDLLLESVERGGFIHARRAPGGPEIQDHDLAAEVGEARGFAIERELKIGSDAAANARLALAVVGMRE